MNYPLLQTRGKSGASYKVVAYTEMVSHGVYKPTMGDYVDSFYANLQKWRSETYYLSSGSNCRSILGSKP